MAHFRCQECHQPLEFTGPIPEEGISLHVPSSSNYAAHGSGAGARGGGAGQGPNMDESFVVLPEETVRRKLMPGTSGLGAVGPSGGGSGWTGKLEESFVVLPPGGGPAGTNPLTTLSRIFDLASHATQIDQPICTECVKQLREELEHQIREAEGEVQAYEECLSHLQTESEDEALPEEQFAAELAKMAEEERALRQQIESLEVRQEAAVAEERQLAHEEAEQRQLVATYWHQFNQFHHQLQQHMEDRDAVLARIEATCEMRELLRRTNVYNDAFHIWHAGPFGTINNFRLGRLPNLQVEWDEINAAWGQACLLLHTMAQVCKLTFSSYRILPMGSHPRIADSKNVYSLYGSFQPFSPALRRERMGSGTGPVNPFWSSSYDKAMVCFLACLQEFADFAKARDIAYNQSLPFELPYKIEQDKVDGKTIKYSFNRDDKWTAALKLMLSNLKVALAWLTNNDQMTS